MTRWLISLSSIGQWLIVSRRLCTQVVWYLWSFKMQGCQPIQKWETTLNLIYEYRPTQSLGHWILVSHVRIILLTSCCSIMKTFFLFPQVNCKICLKSAGLHAKQTPGFRVRKNETVPQFWPAGLLSLRVHTGQPSPACSCIVELAGAHVRHIIIEQQSVSWC